MITRSCVVGLIRSMSPVSREGPDQGSMRTRGATRLYHAHYSRWIHSPFSWVLSPTSRTVWSQHSSKDQHQLVLKCSINTCSPLQNPSGVEGSMFVLLSTANLLRNESSPSSAGIVPSRSFSSKLKKESCDKRPSSLGIVEDSSFLLTFRCVRPVK